MQIRKPGGGFNNTFQAGTFQLLPAQIDGEVRGTNKNILMWPPYPPVGMSRLEREDNADAIQFCMSILFSK